MRTIKEQQKLEFIPTNLSNFIDKLTEMANILKQKGIYNIDVSLCGDDELGYELKLFGERWATVAEVEEMEKQKKKHSEMLSRWETEKVYGNLSYYIGQVTKMIKKREAEILILNEQQSQFPDRFYFKKVEKLNKIISEEKEAIDSARKLMEKVRVISKLTDEDRKDYKSLKIWHLARGYIPQKNKVLFR